jgi:hypothetical protein
MTWIVYLTDKQKQAEHEANMAKAKQRSRR